MRSLSKILFGTGVLIFSASVFAQNYEAPPADVSVHQPAAPGFPSGVPTPVVDAASYVYLPWLGQNIQLLVNYSHFFYQLQQGVHNGANSVYNIATTVLANTQLVPTLQDTTQKTTDLTLKDIEAMLTYGGGNAVPASLVNVTGTDTSPNSSGDNFLNADLLVGLQSYDTSDNSQAATSMNQLVQFLSGQAQAPIGLIFSSDSATRKQQMQSADVQSYILAARTMAAAQSVAISNLRYLSQERTIVPGLGAKSGMTTLPTDGTQNQINDASQLQLEQFLVDRRVGNKAWYTHMNTASSIEVQRETLFVLAEISKQIFEQKLLMERMLAQTVAVQQPTMQINQNKLNFDQQSIQQNLSSAGGVGQ